MKRTLIVSMALAISSSWISSSELYQVSGVCDAEVGGKPTISWQIITSDSSPRCVERFIINHADSVDRLCFTQLPQQFKIISAGDSIVEINAGYYYLTSPDFGTSKKDITIYVECGWPLRSVSWCPESFHAITKGGRIIPVAVHEKQSMINAALNDEKWMKWVLPADSIYRLNQRLSKGKIPGPFDIAPSLRM